MQLDSRKIKVPSEYYLDNLKDGSVRIVRYTKIIATQDLVQLRASYSTNYNLQINLPSQRSIDTMIIVARSSVNCYRLIISSPTNTHLENCKTYDEINNLIRSHIK